MRCEWCGKSVDGDHGADMGPGTTVLCYSCRTIPSTDAKQEEREMTTQSDKNEAREALGRILKPGDTVFTILRSASNSGASRQIGLVVISHDESSGLIDLHPNWSAATLLGRRVNKARDGIVCQGGGMDMGFDLVYSLSMALFGDGYALKQRWL